jgi:hypothetical protein
MEDILNTLDQLLFFTDVLLIVINCYYWFRFARPQSVYHYSYRRLACSIVHGELYRCIGLPLLSDYF